MIGKPRTFLEISAYLESHGFRRQVLAREDERFFEAIGHYVANKRLQDLTTDRELQAWLAAPPSGGLAALGLSRLALSIYHVRKDLQDTFPALPRDSDGLRHWMDDGFLKEKAAAEPRAFQLIPDRSTLNLIGLHQRETGLANVLRSVAASLRPVRPINIVDLDLARRRTKTDAPLLFQGLSICFMPPSELAKAVVMLGDSFLGAKRNICFLAWETSRISPCYRHLLARFDEIWCYSGFTRQAVLELLPAKPVRVVPLCVEAPGPARHRRGDFRLTDEHFVIGFHFDGNSSLHRKNPLALVQAFRRAFPPAPEHRHLVLFLKVHNLDRSSASSKKLRRQVQEDDRIRLVGEYWQRGKVYDWLSSLDLYASLHRSEGFGYGMAEAMIRGVPTIATGYSGNLQFMNEDNSLLVNYRLTPIDRGQYSTVDDQEWADPSIDDAAEKLRKMYHQPDLRTRLAAAGRQSVSKQLAARAFTATILNYLGIPPRAQRSPAECALI